MRHKIFIASSWRNVFQPGLVLLLRSWGHEVYDFRNPLPGDTGFNWAEIDEEWKDWTAIDYRSALMHSTAERGYQYDIEALKASEIVVLLLPSGSSAHSEAAWHQGKGKPVIVHIPQPCEPELMHKMHNAITVDEQGLFFLLRNSVEEIKEMRLQHAARRSEITGVAATDPGSDQQ